VASGDLGDLLWAVALETKLPSKGAHPVATGHFIYFPTDTNQIIALDTAETDVEAVIKWWHQIDSQYRCHSLAVWNDYLVLSQEYLGGFPAPPGELIILSAKSGEEIWRYPVEGASVSVSTIQAGVAYFTVNTGWVYAVDLSALQEQWHRRVKVAWSWSPAAPCYTLTDLLIFPGRSNHLIAFDPTINETAWTFSANGWFPETPILVDDTLYVRCWDHNLYAINATNGQEIWRYPAPRDYSSNLWIEDDHLYIGVKDYQDGADGGSPAYALYTFDRHSGERLARYQVEGRIIARPVGTKTAVFFATDDRSRQVESQGTLYALDPSGHEPIWSPHVVEQRFQSDLLLVNNLLIVGTRQGAVYAFQTSPAETILDPPQLYLEQEAWESAAIAYALQGEYVHAAKLYVEKLDQPLQAGRLYLQAAEYRSVIQLLGQSQAEVGHALAVKAAQAMPDAIERAEALSDLDEDLAAAKAYLEAGVLELAGDHFQKAQAWEEAQTAYAQVQEAEDKWKIITRKLEGWQDLIDRSLMLGDPAQAGQICEEQGWFLKAAEYYDQAGLQAEAVAAYQQVNPDTMTDATQRRLAELAETIGETQVALAAYQAAGDMVKLAALAEVSGHYRQALQAYRDIGNQLKSAEMLEKLQRYKEAAEIFEEIQREARAAENWEQQVDQELERLGGVRYARNRSEIEEWLSKALRLYQEEQDFAKKKSEREHYHQCIRRCQKKLMQIRREPLLQITLRTDSLVVNKSCAVHFVVTNVGWGAAENLSLVIKGQAYSSEIMPLLLGSLRRDQQITGAFTIVPTVAGQIMLQVQLQSRSDDGTSRDVALEGDQNILLTTQVDTGVDTYLNREARVDDLGSVWHESPSDSSGDKGDGESIILRDELNRQTLQRRLTQHRVNLSILQEQAAPYGAGQAPLYLLNQIEAEENQIEDLKTQLATLKE
jgi:outer membrane protein assembly factor BamB